MAVRISDEDRDEAVEALTQHRVAGRLGETDFLQRVERALAAEDEAGLRDLFSDLPAPWPEVALRSRRVDPPTMHPAVATFTDLASRAAEKVVEAVESFTGVQVGRRLPYPQVISPLHNRIRLSDLAIAATVDHHGKVDPTFPRSVEAVQKALINEGLLDAGSVEFGRWNDATHEAYRVWGERSGATPGRDPIKVPDAGTLGRLGQRYGFTVDPTRRPREEADVAKRVARAEGQARAARASVNSLITAALALIPTAMFMTGTWQVVIIAALVAVILGSGATAFLFTRLGERTWNQLGNDDLPALQRRPRETQ